MHISEKQKAWLLLGIKSCEDNIAMSDSGTDLKVRFKSEALGERLLKSDSTWKKN